MKRDLDHIRTLLLKVEAATADKPIAFDSEADAFAAALAVEADLLLGFVQTDAANHPCIVIPFRLTWKGYDFLDATRDTARWRTLLSRLADRTIDFTFDAILGTLSAAARTTIQQLL